MTGGRKDQNERLVASIRNPLKCHRTRLGKFHRKATSAEFTPELLTKQRLDVRFVIDDKN